MLCDAFLCKHVSVKCNNKENMDDKYERAAQIFNKIVVYIVKFVHIRFYEKNTSSLLFAALPLNLYSNPIKDLLRLPISERRCV